MVLSKVPSACSPFVMRDVLHRALQTACSDDRTRAKHGHGITVTGGSDPEVLWAAESRQLRGRSRPSQGFARVQMSPPSVTYVSLFRDFAFALRVTRT